MDKFVIRQSKQSSSVGSESGELGSCTTPKKRPCTDSDSEPTPKRKFCDKEYDKNRRVREFKSSWVSSYPWVKHEEKAEGPGVMFCTTCRAYPDYADKSSAMFQGCSTFRIDSLKKHDSSIAHIKCTERKQKDSMNGQERTDFIANSPIVKCANRSATINMNIFKIMFNTVYLLAKKGKPMSDYETHMELHLMNHDLIGSDYINIGTNYLTEKSAREFLMNIAAVMKTEATQELKRARFYTVLADGSTDCSVIEQYVVLLRFVNKDGYPVTQFGSIEAAESATADGVLKCVTDGLGKLNLDVKSKEPALVCANFDGAAVMMGCNSGVSTQLKDTVPHLVSVHCVAHKLELSVLDAVKTEDYLKKFENTVKQIFKFYYRSPKRRRELKAVAEMLESELSHYGDIKTVRWVASKMKALKAIKSNLHVTIAHLENAAASDKGDTGSTAKGLLKEIQSARFVKYLHMMLDFLSAVTATSVKFQKNNLLVVEVEQIINDLSGELELMKTEPGENTQEYISCFDTETMEFKTKNTPVPVVLKGSPPAEYSKDKDVQCLLEASIKYLEKRFSNFKEQPLSYFSVFDFRFWPSDDKDLLQFGRVEIRNLLTHYREVLTEEEKSSALREWTVLKNRVKRIKTQSLFAVYTGLLAARPDEIKNIMCLIEIMVTISPSTAECERQFSGVCMF